MFWILKDGTRISEQVSASSIRSAIRNNFLSTGVVFWWMFWHFCHHKYLSSQFLTYFSRFCLEFRSWVLKSLLVLLFGLTINKYYRPGLCWFIESYLISDLELFFPDHTAETGHACCLGVALLSVYLDSHVLSFQSTRGSPYYVVYYFKKWPFSFVKCSNSGELGMLKGNGNKSACKCYLFLNI